MCVVRSVFWGRGKWSGCAHTHTHAYSQSQAWSAFGIPGKKLQFTTGTHMVQSA